MFHRKGIAHRFNVQVIGIKQPIRVCANITEEAIGILYISLHRVADDGTGAMTMTC